MATRPSSEGGSKHPQAFDIIVSLDEESNAALSKPDFERFVALLFEAVTPRGRMTDAQARNKRRALSVCARPAPAAINI